MGIDIATGVGIASGLLSGAGSLAASGAEKQQQRQQAAYLEKQAKLKEQTGAIEAETIDRQKSKLRREYEREMGANRVALGQGNVDLASGSANQVALGNIDRFADDVSENEFNRNLKLWETAQSAKQYRAEASQLEAKASNWGASLLSAGLGALSTGLSTYSMAGGKFFSDPASEGGKWATNWDKGVIDKTGKKVLEMRHPSNKWTKI